MSPTLQPPPPGGRGVSTTESFTGNSILSVAQPCASQNLSRVQTQKSNDMLGLPMSVSTDTLRLACLAVLPVNMQLAISRHASKSDTNQVTTILRCHQRRGPTDGTPDGYRLSLPPPWFSHSKTEPVTPASTGQYPKHKCSVNDPPAMGDSNPPSSFTPNAKKTVDQTIPQKCRDEPGLRLASDEKSLLLLCQDHKPITLLKPKEETRAL